MNKQIQRNNISRMLRTSNRNRNVLRWGSGETDAHITMKFNICKKLLIRNLLNLNYEIV